MKRSHEKLSSSFLSDPLFHKYHIFCKNKKTVLYKYIFNTYLWRHFIHKSYATVVYLRMFSRTLQSLVMTLLAVQESFPILIHFAEVSFCAKNNEASVYYHNRRSLNFQTVITFTFKILRTALNHFQLSESNSKTQLAYFQCS